jgi:hypothetical protein
MMFYLHRLSDQVGGLNVFSMSPFAPLQGP